MVGFTEGDEGLADGVIVKTSIKQTATGTVEERVEMPIWSNEGVPAAKTKNDPFPETFANQGDDHFSYSNRPAENNENYFDNPPSPQHETGGSGRTQSYYMQEFVKRVNPMLRALLFRENKGHSNQCGRCSEDRIAVWRCKDCTASRLLCRGCIRDSHMECPTHRIEVWTGSYFRPAELWEVGLYILIRHHADHQLCDPLKFQLKTLANLQRRNDSKEQARLVAGPFDENQDSREKPGTSRGHPTKPSEDFGEDFRAPLSHLEDDEETFAKFAERLDNMYQKTHQEDNNFEGNEDDIVVDDDENNNDLPLPADYVTRAETNDTADMAAANPTSADYPDEHFPSVDTPRVDALKNPYVRVVHTNGVHNIALVYCSCRGRETSHSDLMAAGLVPASFVRYRTVFTHEVLDDFRLSNLECKSSAYQYFQKLRRLTSPMSPDTVPNLYHELRRMSRLWRWMKKLKWAGVAHRPDGSIDTKPGELANFCPACPQPGVNIPDNWWMNPEDR